MALVLIVDDEEMERILDTAILETAGHEILYARDGLAAMDVCRSRDVEVILTDLAMPEASGLRLIRELREALADVPIIAVSGWARDQLDLALEYGADFALTKPLDAQDLLQTVEKSLELPTPRPSVNIYRWNRPYDQGK